MRKVALHMKRYGVPFISDIAPLVLCYRSAGFLSGAGLSSRLEIVGAVKVPARRASERHRRRPIFSPSASFFLCSAVIFYCIALWSSAVGRVDRQ